MASGNLGMISQKKVRAWLLPPVSTQFILQGKRYQVTFTNPGKLRFAARYIGMEPAQAAAPKKRGVVARCKALFKGKRGVKA